MIHYLLPELMAQKSRERGSRLSIKEIAEDTGVSANTLSRMINVPGYSCSVAVIDDLCRYFECKVEDLLLYVNEGEEDAPEEV